jgi:Histidine kinase
MLWPFYNKQEASYWVKVFALYALTEAAVQLMFFIILNTFGTKPVSLIEIHLLMWLFQCLLIWPVWWVAWTVRKKNILTQILVNVAFYIVYSYIWFGPVQDAIGYLYNNLLQLTRSETNRLAAVLDNGDNYSYLNYQLLKHAFRLSWFYLAAYFYNYQQEEKKRTALAVANKELELKMLKWHLNPSFYFNTIHHLRQLADKNPLDASAPILQLAKLMEYIIYDAREKLTGVQREILFLSNYIHLKNLQISTHPVFEMKVTGEYDRLKIAPLLLTGIIDEIITYRNLWERKTCSMLLQFSGKELQLIITGDMAAQNEIVLLPGGSIDTRLRELYPERYSVKYLPGNKQFKFSLLLDEE